VSGHAKIPPASHQVSATSLKLLIQQINPHVRVDRINVLNVYEASGGKYAPRAVFFDLEPAEIDAVFICPNALKVS
jgi:hypothetical protein